MKNLSFLFIIFFCSCSLMHEGFAPENKYTLLSATVLCSNDLIVYVRTSAPIPSSLPLSNENFLILGTAGFSHPTNFTLVQGQPAILLLLSNDLLAHDSVSLQVQPGQDFPLQTENFLGIPVAIQKHDLVLYNSLDSLPALASGNFGPALTPGSGTAFLEGRWGNGVDCGSNTLQTNSIRIPGGVIPMGDFTIEMWYTKTSAFTEGNVATLLFTGDNTVHNTNILSLAIAAPWDLTAFGAGKKHCIFFGLRINTINQKEVYLVYDFGNLQALNAAFPLNTPVHIAISKRNSDGQLRIFLNGVPAPAQYLNCNEPFYTTNTTFIANKSGFFPYEMIIGNIHAIRPSSPAKGTIDNIKVYRTPWFSFDTTLP